MLKKFAPEISAQLLPEIYALRLTLRDGVRKMVESIPSTSYPEIIEFMRPQPMRRGFVELLDFLDTKQVPLVVVSGGLTGMVKTVLGDLVSRVHAIHAFDVDTSNPYLRVQSKFEDGTELVSKVRVLELYQADEKISIGDSVTDLNMALATPVVFARDRLAQYLDERQKKYILWNDFFDIRDRLLDSWG